MTQQIEKPAAGSHSPAGSQNGFRNQHTPQQCDLFGDVNRESKKQVPVFAKKDPATSQLAGEEMLRSGAIAEQKRRFIDWMRGHPEPRTSAEIARDGGFDRYDVARRMSALERDGLVERCPVRICFVGGRPCVTWRALPAEVGNA